MPTPPLTHQPPINPSAIGYGGQAVIEGIMIRGPRHAVVVCRRPDGSLTQRSRQLGVTYAGRVRRIPLVRGILTLAETLHLGFWALMFAQRVALQEDNEDVEEGIDPLAILTMLIALGIAIGVFFLGPVFATRWIEDTSAPAILSVIAEGLLRILLLLGYLWLIGKLPDVRRVFQFHGAEHKAIAAWEAGDQLTPERVNRYSRAHPRCGTSFLLVVAVVAIIVFTALGNPPLWWRLTSRIVLVPVIAAVAYEVIRLGGLYRHHPVVATLFAPNLWLQSLTTREPDPEHLSVAIAAMESALELEAQPAEAS